MASHADSTGLRLPTLTEENYLTWSTKAEFVLKYRGVWDVVVNGLPEAATPEQLANNDQASCILVLSLPEHHLPVVRRPGMSAKGLWDYFADIYHRQSVARVLHLRQQLTQLRMGNEGVTQYIARAQALQGQLAVAGHELSDADLFLAFLAGLPESYSTIRTVIKCTVARGAAAPPIHEILPQLLDVEEDLKRSAYKPGAALVAGAPAAFFNRDKNRKCYHCKQKGHIKPNCRKWLQEQRQGVGQQRAFGQQRVFAGHQQQAGSPQRTPGQHQGQQQQQSPLDRIGRHAVMMVRCGSSIGNGSDSGSSSFSFSGSAPWAIDSGCFAHLCNDYSLLVDPTPLPAPQPVMYGNDSFGHGTVVGTVHLPVIMGADTVNLLTLTNVLFVPKLHCNLLSVKAGTESKEFIISFSDTKAAVFPRAADDGGFFPRPDGDPVAYATRQPVGDLYFLDIADVSKPARAAMVATAPEQAALWHARYGHLSPGQLAMLVDKGMVTGLPVSAAAFNKLQDTVCEPCALGKQSKLPFPSSSNPPSVRPLQLVHTDLCGPMRVPSVAGSVYFITLLDDFSGFCVVGFLETKDQATDFIVSQLLKWENELQLSTAALRSDRGGEFVNRRFKEWCDQRGIQHQLSAPYSPQQNGAAERVNRTLLERARCMLAASSLPKEYWADAINTASIIRLLSPTRGLSKTPWEMFYNEGAVDVSFMRVFGARCYVLTPKPMREGKLSNVSERGVFLGYVHAGYKIKLDNGSVVVSRDVQFNEQPFVRASLAKDTAAADDESGGLLLGSWYDLLLDGHVYQQAEAAAAHQAAAAAAVGQAPAAAAAGVDAAGAVGAAGDVLMHDAGAGAGAGAAPANAANHSGVQGTRHSTRSNFGQPRGDWWVPRPALMVGSDVVEPATYKEAVASPYASYWLEAMNEELASLRQHNTYTLEPLPHGVAPLPVKWVYSLKRDATGAITRFKARLVAKGYAQQEGIDFTETFAPVSKHPTFRLLLAKAAAENLDLYQVDVRTAFLYGELEELIYMQQPPGYEEGDLSIACRLNKSLYGLRQAPRVWYNRLKQELALLGFLPSESDAGLFIKRLVDYSVYMVIWVDDCFIAAPAGTNAAASVVAGLAEKFEVHDIGEANYFLGMEIVRDRERNTIKLSQNRYVTDVVDKYKHFYYAPTGKGKDIPMSPATKLSKEDSDVLDYTKYPYRELVGSLLYAAVCTRPDIALSVGILARHMASPTSKHWAAAIDVVKYLAGTKGYGITYSGTDVSAQGWCDSDYGGDLDTRRSTAGYIFTINRGAVIWSSKRQPTVAVSTAEAEYIAAAAAVKEALWLHKVLIDLDMAKEGPVNIWCDNQAAIKLLKHPIASARSKHIDIAHHFVRERVEMGEVEFAYCSTESNLADCMTKALPSAKFAQCRLGMGVME